MVGQSQALTGQMARPAEAPVVPEFEIIPVKAIPLVAVALIGLVAAILSEKLWPLEFYHVVFGGTWTAIDLFVGLIVGPILGRLSVQGRIEFLTRFMPKMVLLMPTLPLKATPIPKPGAPRMETIQRGFEMLANTAPFDVTGHPAMSVPCGMSDGLPAGMMLVAKHFDEVSIYRAASAFEKAGDWQDIRP